MFGHFSYLQDTLGHTFLEKQDEEEIELEEEAEAMKRYQETGAIRRE